jgi:hypothetical protein
MKGGPLGRSGLTVSSLQWAGGFTGSDGRSFEDSLSDARLAIQTADKLRAGCLIIHSGARGVHTHNHARRLIRLALAKLLPLAEERGIKLALEPMNGDCGADFTFLNCLDETLQLVEPARPRWHRPGHLLLGPHRRLTPPRAARHPNRRQLGEGAVPGGDHPAGQPESKRPTIAKCGHPHARST